jgi:hypothetical protein
MKSIAKKRVKVYFKNNRISFRNFILAVRPSTIDCPDDRLFLTVTLDDIHPDDISLGDEDCKPTWSNETHAQFITHIDNCSLVKKFFLFYSIGKKFKNWNFFSFINIRRKLRKIFLKL